MRRLLGWKHLLLWCSFGFTLGYSTGRYYAAKKLLERTRELVECKEDHLNWMRKENKRRGEYLEKIDKTIQGWERRARAAESQLKWLGEN